MRAHETVPEFSGSLGLRLGWGRELLERLRRQPFPCERCKHAVGDPRRKMLRPLVHRLVRDANRVGGGGDSPEQIDGFSFQHAPLNHSSALVATMVPGIIATMVEEKQETYGDRLKAAMDAAGVSMETLAKHLGVTRNAIKKLIGGGSAEMTATNNAKTALFLGVDSDALALGVRGVNAALEQTRIRRVFHAKA